MSFIQDAKLKAGVWWRERKERAEEKRAANVDPAGVTVPAWLVRATKAAAWIATFALIYFLWLYTLDIARDRAEALHLTHVGGWVGELQFWFPHIIGFAVVAVGIPYVAKIAIPTFVSLTWQQDPTAKIWSLLIAVAVSLVVISGTFAVQGHTIMERDRDAAVAVEGVQQEAAVLASRIADKRAELDDMVNNASVYIRTAASMSPAAYEAFLEQRRDDWQYERLLSYRATAVDAQRLRDEIAALRDQQARQTAVASVAREVVTEQTGWISSTLGWLEGVRAILLSLVMDIVALIMPLIALRLEQARNRQLGLVDGIPLHSYMLEAPRDGERPISPDTLARRSAQDVVDAMIAGGADPRFAADMARAAARSGAAQSSVKDADTDQIIIDKDGDMARVIREHTRKVKGKDGKPIKMVMPAQELPDESGVTTDGGGRMASVESADASQPDNADSSAADEDTQDIQPSTLGPESAYQGSESANNDPEQQHPEPSELLDLNDEALVEALAEQSVDADQGEDQQNSEAEAKPEAAAVEDETVEHNEPRSEPETDERKLIAAE